ncbi:hypothetical protein GYM62_01980 [Algoriphagus sp. NBT04N3]|uniref:TlpA family protein disulfide reductase n=1 Tax=Algoriphagus sp. NBT04N3 TaxID=2705473 RepID=UPI001C629E71|nr:thioredoxin-like domain-containing protein [Algoriphagus sp. NBT04N3]QYH37630.1 hypothetical protein GYM62_01980 [Algoriphagus sp. NBT04N3]
MNKLLYTFFLGYTLLYGGNLLSQRKVADSPTGNGLVDASSLQSGREEYSTPAQKGEENTTLIYGEIINPDSLGPLSLKITPYYISPRTTFLQEELLLDPMNGEFYDGVVNPRTRKFDTRISLSDRPGYLSLFLGNRPLLEDYLVLPGDSIKLKLDLSRNAIIFAGKNQDFYEAQFALKRLDQRREFDSPRQLIIPETSTLLTRPGSQEKIDYFRGKFGAELLILKPGKESLHYLIAQADQAEDILKPKLEILDFYQPKLSPKNWDLLRAEVYGNFYYSILSTFRKFHYPYVENKFSAKDREHYRQRLTDLLTRVGNLEFDSQSKLISAAFLDLELERLILNALWKNRSFLELVQENHSGELADRLQAAYLSNYLASHTGQEEILLNYLSKTESSPWKDRIENLKRATIPGEPIEDAHLISMSGDTLNVSDLPNQPTLVYFYFSTCAHSASYFKNYLFPLYQELEAEGIKLIAISVDEDSDLWKERIFKYSDPSIPNFNLRGLSKERWKELYEITSFPRVMLLDRDSRILSFDIKPLGETQKELLQEFRKKFNDELSTKTNTSL